MAKDILWKAVFTTPGFTGLRQSEQRGLEWHDVDFAKRLIDVRRAYTQRDGFKIPRKRSSSR